MRTRHLRWILPLLSMAAMAGSAGALAWAVLSPCHVDSALASSARSAHDTEASSAQRGLLAPAAFAPLVQRQFQRPLYDPPPPKPPPPVVEKEPPPPPVRLLATMPEPGGGHAMLEFKGAMVIKKQGETLADGNLVVEIVEIGKAHVVVRHEGRSFTLQLGTE